MASGGNLGKNSHGHIPATHYPIDFMYLHRLYSAFRHYNDCWRI